MSNSKVAVCDFLKRCVLYADSSINRKRDRGDDAEELKRWMAYRDFTAYALSEVERGELDDADAPFHHACPSVGLRASKVTLDVISVAGAADQVTDHGACLVRDQRHRMPEVLHPAPEEEPVPLQGGLVGEVLGHGPTDRFVDPTHAESAPKLEKIRLQALVEERGEGSAR